jgi:hypothetical protein
MRNEQAAVEAIREYEITMGDGWRNDFCDTVEEGEERDAQRRADMINAVKSALGCNKYEAEDFYDRRAMT